ncbi:MULTISPECIES: hypothetical protein [unclassified Burkholderia]|uniref:hypothetical protein n=1 Tax=unclassified Burkholderia TaxID=2613784 RepID=UPI002AB188AB|nr:MULTISPECIES: hypothetical protein [unclassified Burkholderia]
MSKIEEVKQRVDAIEAETQRVELSEIVVPPAVKQRVTYALNVLREQERALQGVQLARGNGHILALELGDRQEKIKRANDILDEFRRLAPGNGVDADLFINQCGGAPDFSKYGQPASADAKAFEHGVPEEQRQAGIAAGNIVDLNAPDLLPADPEGMNDDRAVWAGAALETFRNVTRCDQQDVVSDLVANLMHYCDRNGMLFEDELVRARKNYAEETSGPEIGSEPMSEPECQSPSPSM